MSKLPPQFGTSWGRWEKCRELAGSLGKDSVPLRSEEGTQAWTWHLWEDMLTRGIRKASAATSVNLGKDLAGDVGVSIHARVPFVSPPALLIDSCHCALCSG